jgi:hypothetical protein
VETITEAVSYLTAQTIVVDGGFTISFPAQNDFFS